MLPLLVVMIWLIKHALIPLIILTCRLNIGRPDGLDGVLLLPGGLNDVLMGPGMALLHTWDRGDEQRRAPGQ